MTNKEALVAELQVSAPVLSMEKAMIDNAIEPGDTYGSSTSKAIGLCAIQILEGMLAQPDVSEGGYSIKQNANIIARLNLLKAKHSVSTGTPGIRFLKAW